MKKLISAIMCVAMMIGVVGCYGGSVYAISADERGFDERDSGSSKQVSGDKSCGGVNTSIISCKEGEEGAIDYLLITVVRILSGLIGILAVGGIVFSGYQYMMSSGDPTAMAKAKQRIINIVYGLVAYALIWGVLEFLIPGGFKG